MDPTKTPEAPPPKQVVTVPEGTIRSTEKNPKIDGGTRYNVNANESASYVTVKNQAGGLPEDVNKDGRRTGTSGLTVQGRATGEHTQYYTVKHDQTKQTYVISAPKGFTPQEALESGTPMKVPPGVHPDDVVKMNEVLKRGGVPQDKVAAVAADPNQYKKPLQTRADLDKAVTDAGGNAAHLKQSLKNERPHTNTGGADKTPHTPKAGEGLARKTGKLGAAFGAAAALGAGNMAQAAELAVEMAPGGTAITGAINGVSRAEMDMRKIEAVPFGGVATEILRPALRAAGVKGVESSLSEEVVKGVVGGTRQQDEFDKVYATLPKTPTPDMPPEVQALVIEKNKIEAAQQKFIEANAQSGGVGKDITKDRTEARKQVDVAQNRYAEMYQDMERNGGMDEVRKYNKEKLEQQQPQQAPQVPAPQEQTPVPVAQRSQSQTSSPGMG